MHFHNHLTRHGGFSHVTSAQPPNGNSWTQVPDIEPIASTTMNLKTHPSQQDLVVPVNINGVATVEGAFSSGGMNGAGHSPVPEQASLVRHCAMRSMGITPTSCVCVARTCRPRNLQPLNCSRCTMQGRRWCGWDPCQPRRHQNPNRAAALVPGRSHRRQYLLRRRRRLASSCRMLTSC
jgi:hypothetical protein